MSWSNTRIAAINTRFFQLEKSCQSREKVGTPWKKSDEKYYFFSTNSSEAAFFLRTFQCRNTHVCPAPIQVLPACQFRSCTCNQMFLSVHWVQWKIPDFFLRWGGNLGTKGKFCVKGQEVAYCFEATSASPCSTEHCALASCWAAPYCACICFAILLYIQLRTNLFQIQKCIKIKML